MSPHKTGAAPVEVQADALIAEIQRKLAERESELLAAAVGEAAAIRERARVKARRQLRRAIAEMRASEHQQLLQLHAELETESRRQASVRAQLALARAWPLLAPALAQRWSDAGTRERWLAAQITLARTRLPATGWRVQHPQDWSAAETQALQARLRAEGITDARLHADAGVAGGLVIDVDSARLDSRPQALLADRLRVESALLARLDADAATEPPP